MSKKPIEEALKKIGDGKYITDAWKDGEAKRFGSILNDYKKKIHSAVKECKDEEHIKSFSNDFLKESFYSSEGYMVNTYGRVDSSITYKGKALVLIENKRPGSPEMVKEDDINRKALWELILYYLDETRNWDGDKSYIKNEADLRRLIITDGFKWFLIDAQDMNKVLEGNIAEEHRIYKRGLSQYSKNEGFYKKVKEYCEKLDITSKLNYIYLDLQKEQTKFIYKALAKEYLLKEPYLSKIKPHVLNNRFYQELLYIMGLREVKEKNKVLIKIDSKASNTIAQQLYHKFKYDKECSKEDAIEKTFELVIIWTNRLLFIKLFEGQLITFNTDEKCYHILENDKITSFQELQDLFFMVLGRKTREEGSFFKRFEQVPYLNSSLFEKYDIETKDVNINELKSDLVVKYNKSILGSKGKKEIPLLEYMFNFLNSYSFVSQRNSINETAQKKEIIDASVLGLIFEKINGYRDGSYYTPSIITEYMCKETVERAIINKINDSYKWNCTSLNEIKEHIGYDMAIALQINDIINTLKICDPAVGSGHFLVSALNRIIAVKSQLRVLFKYKSQERLVEYKIVIEDDVLCVLDGQNNYYTYDKKNMLSQQVQETLFNEKKVIIEECLFGVDINLKAVAICQLRLWIELLKNAYYKENGMETLPNIDINIKQGNSLLHKINYEVGQLRKNQKFDKSTQECIKRYKAKTKEYKASSNKKEKKRIKTILEQCKEQLLYSYQQSFFESPVDKQKAELYVNAFEWAIEFPEILSDEKGTFLGFDIVIGNPPYGTKVEELLRPILSKEYPFIPDYEIYYYFISLSNTLLSNNGLLAYIIPNTFLVNRYAQKYREIILKYWRPVCINNLTDMDIFEQASVRNCIIQLIKNKSSEKYDIAFDNLSISSESKALMLESKVVSQSVMLEQIENWLIIFTMNKHIRPLIHKISSSSNKLNDYFDVKQGYIPYRKVTLIRKVGEVEALNILNNRLWHNNERLDEDYKKELKGGDLERYNISWSGLYAKYGKWVSTYVDLKYFTGERLLIREITRKFPYSLIVSIEKEEFIHNPSIITAIPRKTCDVSIEYFLGLCNSKLFSFFFINTAPKAKKGLFPKALVNDIRNLPIVIGTLEQQTEMINLVIRILMIRLNEAKKDISIYEKQLDNLVYLIYGLTKEEISVVENFKV